ncbi:hypothetical protein AJ87_36545 [Rhizobium yanglingense]|nr:hypothetical protein AJ87_36545 [Rhizobium yanglingense]
MAQQRRQRLVCPLVEVTVEDIGDNRPISKRLLAKRDRGYAQTGLFQAGPVVADEESAIHGGLHTSLQTLDRDFRGSTSDNGNVVHNNETHGRIAQIYAGAKRGPASAKEIQNPRFQ